MIKYIYSMILLGALLLSSCEDQLEENPSSFVNPENFYNNAADAEAAIIAAYAPLNSAGYYEDRFTSIANFASDEATTRVNDGTQGDLDHFRNVNNTANGFLIFFWETAYSLNSRANAVIDRVPSIEGMDESLKRQIVGEAKFLRALNYFNLVRVFGEVPLIVKEVLTADDLDVAKSSQSEIYDLIISDLATAVTDLPASYSGMDVGRATKGAAQGILAKVHLTLGNWEEAAMNGRAIIASGNYSLISNYADVFTAPDDNTEFLFAAQFAAQSDQDNRFSWFYAPQGTSGVTSPTAYGVVQSELLFYNNFPDADPRKEVTFLTEYVNSSGNTVTLEDFNFPSPHVKKYIDLDPLKDYNFPVLRYSDILLITAEAINQSGGPTPEAYGYINQVRNRAGVDPIVPGLDKVDFDEAVFAERRLELPFEGHGYFDLVRTNRLKEYIERSSQFNTTYEAANPNELYTYPRNVTVQVPLNYTFPLPLREIQVNPALKQTEGY